MSTIHSLLHETEETPELMVQSVNPPDSAILSDGTDDVSAKFSCDINDLCAGDYLRISSYVCNEREGVKVPFIYGYEKGHKRVKTQPNEAIVRHMWNRYSQE